jgi:hypothetical protein
MADDDVATAADQFDKLATALGYLVVAFNKLEVALAGALMYLLKQDDEVAGASAQTRQASPSAAPIAPRGQVYLLSVSPPSLLNAISAARRSA